MNPVYTIFVYTVWFLATFFIIAFLLHAFAYRKKLFEHASFGHASTLPTVTIVVPAFNEAEHIEETISSLEAIDYPKELLEVLIISDGSNDTTVQIAQKHADGKHIVLIDNAKNKGKAACLNQGIKLAKGEFVACMDADSQVSPDVLLKSLPGFKSPKVGTVTVTVTVEVNERRTLLQKAIDIEFILGLSLFLKVFSFLNCIFVTPGPFSIYRKSMLSEIGGFDEKSITEDLEIAYRIHRAGYIIENTMQTRVRTYTPESFKSLYVQRKRWYSGAILTFWKHKKMVLESRVGLFRFVVPFTFVILLLGMGLFGYSAYLTIKKLVTSIVLYSHTGFNFFSHMNFTFDPFSFSIFFFYGITGTLLTILFIAAGLKLSKRSILGKLPGSVIYVFFFLLYQFFWVASFVNVLLRRKARWR